MRAFRVVHGRAAFVTLTALLIASVAADSSSVEAAAPTLMAADGADRVFSAPESWSFTISSPAIRPMGVDVTAYVVAADRDYQDEVDINIGAEMEYHDDVDVIEGVEVTGSDGIYEYLSGGGGAGYFRGDAYDDMDDPYYETVYYDVYVTALEGLCEVDGDTDTDVSPAPIVPFEIQETGDDASHTHACSLCASANWWDWRTLQVISQWYNGNGAIPVGAGVSVGENFSDVSVTSGCSGSIDPDGAFDPTDSDGKFIDYFYYCDSPCCSGGCTLTATHRYTYGSTVLGSFHTTWNCTGASQTWAGGHGS